MRKKAAVSSATAAAVAAIPKGKRLYWANFIRQENDVQLGDEPIKCDCIEFNGHIIGVPLKSGETVIESDEDVVVYTTDIDEAIKLFIKKAMEMMWKRKGVFVKKEPSSWTIIEFPYCHHARVEGPVPECSFRRQDTPCAIMVPDGRCDSLNYPPFCPVCAVFAAYHGESQDRGKIGLVFESHDGVNYHTVK